MTKKDYVLIANCLKLLTQGTRAIIDVESTLQPQNFEFLVNQTINKFARELQQENPRFDWDKFLKACNE